VGLATAGAGQPVYVACAGTRDVVVIDSSSHHITDRFPLPARPTGLALSPDRTRIYVTCVGRDGSVEILESSTGKLLGSIPSGHTPMSPVLSQDGGRLFFCNRFDGVVSAVNLAGHELVFERPAGRSLPAHRRARQSRQRALIRVSLASEAFLAAAVTSFPNTTTSR
jgi:DNA-binding beta-propeller fold protein YncE